MKLKLALEQTNLTWTLHSTRSYTVGSWSDCDILLTHISIVTGFSLEFSFDSSLEKWYVRKLDTIKSTSIIINNQVIADEKIEIQGKTYINVAGVLVLIATPISVPLDSTSSSKQSSLLTSTRLLSGYAYLRGIFSGFELLSYLRRHPYKATIPSSSLDLDQISTHAVQAVLISLLSAVAVATISIIQVLIFKMFGWNDYSSPLVIILAIVAAVITSYELIYLRWSLARKFLRKNYNPKIQLKSLDFLQPTVEYFQQGLYQSSILQNIIIFAGSNPFLGYGELIPKSSWTIPIERKLAKQNLEAHQNNIQEISTYEFYLAVDEEVKRLNLPKLQKFSRLFVDGFELDPDSKIISHPTTVPGVMSLDDPLLWANGAHSSDSKQRAYRLYQYTEIERDYILSHFLRFYNAGSITFVESSAYILTGIDRERFSLTSTLDDDLLSRFIKTLLATVVILPGLYAPIALWYIGVFVFNFVSWHFNDVKQKRAAEFQEEYDYGVSQTLREYIAQPLNLEEKRDITRNFGNQNQSFKLNRSIKSIISNPILLIVFILIAPFLLVLGLILILLNFVLNRYRSLDRDVKISFDYYGCQDVFMYWKAIQDAIFNGTIKVLKRHGVDTSQFEETAAGIVNSGVIITAGTITNSQIAGGAASSSTQTQKIIN
ncbi:hypothetical protein NUACC21_68700 [Scytonema sp. NUACC21]